MHKLWITIFAVCFSAPVACDSSKKAVVALDGGGGMDTAREVDAGVVEMKGMEREKLCAAGAVWANNLMLRDEFNTALCGFTGFFAAAASGGTTLSELRTSCKQAYGDCVADERAAIPAGEAACDLPATCDITADELQICVAEWVEKMKLTLASFPACATLAPTDLNEQRLGAIAEAYSIPSSCTVLESKCPGLLR